MPLNNSEQAIIDRRRELVASMLLRKMTQRQIVEKLEANQEINPETNEAWSLGTINGDVKALRRQWQTAAKAKIQTHQARQFMELEEIKRAAWAAGDYETVRRSLETEMKLLGTAQEKVKHELPDGSQLIFNLFAASSSSPEPSDSDASGEDEDAG